VFNLQGSEIIFILLIALVVLGPEKLPGAIKRVMGLYHELRKLSSGFQDEFKSVLDEPLREIKSTTDLMKNAVDPKRIAERGEREAEQEAAAERKAQQARTAAEDMEAAGAAHLAASSVAPTVEDEPEVDAFADPVDVEQGLFDDVENAADEGDVGAEEADESTSVPRLSSVDLDVEPEGEPDVESGDEPAEKSA
jgi:sec-independent protein translocase protein TatB